MKFARVLAAAAVATMGFVGAAMADGDEIKEFRIGILGGENEADRIRANECLVERWEALLGVPVRLFPAADYAGTLEGLLGGTLDYAILGASGYAGIWLEDPSAVEPVLTTEQSDGSTGYYSVMVARKDSGIASIEDMQGKRLGFADPNSTSGFLVPSVAFTAMGLNADEYFASTGFSGGHEQNVLAVLNGDVDAGVTWASGVGEWEEGYSNGNLRKMVDKGLVDMNDLVQIWQSPLIPNGPIVVRQSLPPAIKAAITGDLIRMSVDDQECMYAAMAGEMNGFVPVTHEFYETIVAARKAKIKN